MIGAGKVARLIVVVLSAVLFLHAQDASRAQPKHERHMEQVKWDLLTQKLIAVVVDGRVEGKKFIPEKITDYEIDLKNARITVNGEHEDFGHYEGELMWRLVDLIAQYAGESVMFYDDAHTEKPKQEAKRQ
jgi:hypothetical protein